MAAREPDAGFRYWAFISYSHRDQAWGRWLARALETYRIPSRLVGQPIAAGTIPARLTPVFRDRDELPTATDLDRTVAEALRQSWCLIVICSAASAQSRWVNEEVREFQRLGRGERIHCLLVDGVDGVDAATPAPCFPPALSERPWGRATAGEPIAADLRRAGDGKASARLKLVAGILGISYDKLVQRDHQRGYRRMAMIATAAVLALALLTTFTLITITARRDAEAQRGHAEGLVEFMLGDLRTRLEPEGRLATLDAVGKEALDYYAAQDPARLDADALARRARALLLIGEVYDQRGRLDDALAVFRQAVNSTAELLARDPSSPQRIFDHAQSQYWVGLIAWRRGENDVAESAFRSYMDLAERLVAHDPANPDWQAEVEYASSNLGTVLSGEGRLTEAAVYFEKALGVAKELARHAPNDIDRRVALAQAHAWVADMRSEEGRLQDAVTQREAEVAIYEDILSTDARNLEVKDGLMMAERELANLALMRGDTGLAVRQARRAADLADELTASDPDNAVIAARVSIIHAMLGDALHFAGDMDGAKVAIQRARDLAKQLVERDPTVVIWQTQFARSLLQQALLDPDGDALAELRSIQGVLQRLDTLRESVPLSRSARLLYAEGLLAAGERNATLGKPLQAEENWRKVLTEVQGGSPLDGPRAQAILALALLHLGRADEARTLLAHLASIGYRDPGFARTLASLSSPRLRPASAAGHERKVAAPGHGKPPVTAITQ